MKISTKGRYALRLMLDLALHYNGEYISLKDIAKRQSISEKYLEQIISQLGKSGLVSSIRGAKGGYILSEPPERYTVGKILRIVEGDLSVVSCLSSDKNTCDRAASCVTVEVWEKVNKAISEVVDNITLRDLVDKTIQKGGNNYCI